MKVKKFCVICFSVYGDGRKKVCEDCGNKTLSKNQYNEGSMWKEKESITFKNYGGMRDESS